MKSVLIILFLLLINCTIFYSQKDSTRLFNEDELNQFKDWRGIGYFLTGDSTVMKLVSCRNSNEICEYNFYLAKYYFKDSTFHLIGKGKYLNDSSGFDVFQIYVGVISKNTLTAAYKYLNIKYGVFDIIFKVKPEDELFFNYGNYSEQLHDFLFFSMDKFKLGELIYGK